MAILAGDSVIQLTSTTGACQTITVDELTQLILGSPLVQQYQGATANTLSVGGAWMLDNTITINVEVDATP